MRQVTLVALYGAKPSALSELICECQRRIADVVPGFQQYEMEQVHATIVGLERETGSALLNLNLVKYRNQRTPMDFEGLLEFIRKGGRFPFQVQVGGFRNRPYPFQSRNKDPYERSFSVQGDKCVLMGWPTRGDHTMGDTPSAIDLVRESRIYPTALDQIRQAFQGFNVLHGYHQRITEVDNDLYLRIGILKAPNPDESTSSALECEVRDIREFLSKEPPVIINIEVSCLYVASYEQDTLPLRSTRAWSLSDPKVTPDFIRSLYE